MNSKETILLAVRSAITTIYNKDIDTSKLLVEKPKQTSLGDVAVPMFTLAKELNLSPVIIAGAVCDELKKQYPNMQISVASAYVNIFLDKTISSKAILTNILNAGANYGKNSSLQGKKVMVEFSGPNTNKPLHLGHLRNDCLGEAVCRLQNASGADVMRVNIVNDRGVHICKSMLAYQLFANGATPESTNRKSDHFVGDYYVRFNEYEKTNPNAEKEAQALLNLWEDGDVETLKLWRLMNDWAVNGIKETYDKTGISFDKIYFESHTYKLGKDIIENGLANNVFYKNSKDASIRMDIRDLDKQENEEFDEDKGKVFLRGDGTSVYITQDLGTAVLRHEDFAFDSLVYVVASEQKRHFELLFHAITKLGYSWGKDMFHLSYGMVNLPDGKMKSREGTVVDADNLIDELTNMAQAEIETKGRTTYVEQDTAFKIALGAIHYYLLQVSPAKDMTFHKEDSLNFNGNTGPYLQYSAVRLASMLAKEEGKQFLKMPLDSSLLTIDDEWQIVKHLGDFTSVVEKSAMNFEPNLLANYLYDLAKMFNKYYHDVQILNETNTALIPSRLHLCRAIHIVIKNGLYLLNIPYVDRM